MSGRWNVMSDILADKKTDADWRIWQTKIQYLIKYITSEDMIIVLTEHVLGSQLCSLQ